MPYATTETLGAGSTLFFEHPANSGTFVELANVLTIGPVGSQGEAVQVTPIKEKTHRYIGGMQTPADQTLTFNHIPSITDYQNYLARVCAQETIKHRIDYESGDRVELDIAMFGAQLQAPESGSQNKMDVNGKQSGVETWSEAPAPTPPPST